MVRRSALMSICVAVALAGCGIAPVKTGPIVDAIAPIGVVRTWGEMCAQPGHRLADGRVVRLGVDRINGPRKSGALFYVMEEGPEKVVRIDRDHSGPVGPIHYRFPPGFYVHESFEEDYRILGPTCTRRLYVTTLPLTRIGRNDLLVHDDLRQRLGEAKIECLDEAYDPWFHLGIKSNVAGRCLMEVLAGESLPAWGVAPVMWEVADRSLRPETPLPVIEATPGEHLSLEVVGGRKFVIETTTDIMISDRSRVFLCRWWVNGKPVTGGGSQGVEPGEDASHVFGRRIVLEFDDLGPAIGAKRGDRVAVQLLYSLGGSDFIEGPSKAWLAAVKEGYFPNRPLAPILVSERREFVLP